MCTGRKSIKVDGTTDVLCAHVYTEWPFTLVHACRMCFNIGTALILAPFEACAILFINARRMRTRVTVLSLCVCVCVCLCVRCLQAALNVCTTK